MLKLNSVEEAIRDLQAGKMVVVVDHHDREDEGDLVMAAEFVDEKAINFMINKGRGLICTPMTEEKAKELELDQMIQENKSLHHTRFTVSIDHIYSGTGISAHARAMTIEALTNEQVRPSDFVRPGHIFPLIAQPGGVLVRPGHTEASVDLCQLANLKDVGVICEILNDDGTMTRGHQLTEFCEEHDLKMVAISDLIDYRKTNENFYTAVEKIELPTRHGDWEMTYYQNQYNPNDSHLVLSKGSFESGMVPLVRAHSECLTGDVFGSKRCDCGDQLSQAMDEIDQYGYGYILYLRQEGRGIGLLDKLRAYKLQEEGLDTVEANLHLGHKQDGREYHMVPQILKNLGIHSIKLMTNNLDKVGQITKYGINVVERVPLEICPVKENQFYLLTKKNKLNHQLSKFIQ